MNIITKLKLHYLKYCIKDIVLWYIYCKDNKYKKIDKQRVWIFLGADYGNLGDVAITLFQERFLREWYPEAKIVTVPISETISAIPNIKRVIGKRDVVTLIGGGNISDLYEDIEFLRQLVIRSFPKNKIISFPQSVYLTPTAGGIAEKQRINKTYRAHKDFIILMRDKLSFQRMKQIIPDGDVRLAPDIVMLADERIETLRKNQVLICLRKDNEKKETDSIKISSIINELKRKEINLLVCDTQIEDDKVKLEGGEYHLNKLLDQFRSSSLVITNRLHGMIFAFITGTPAIVLDNSTGKVSSTFDWLKDCGFIHFADSDFKLEHLSYTDNFEKVSSRIKEIFDNTMNITYTT